MEKIRIITRATLAATPDLEVGLHEERTRAWHANGFLTVSTKPGSLTRRPS